MTIAQQRQAPRTPAAGLVPFDERKAADRDHVLEWIDSGAELYQRPPPDQPPQHLVT
jgi:hypothetical protein